MISPQNWRWPLLASIAKQTFRPRDTTPLPLWAKRKVFLSRRVTTKPGPYDPDEFPWTWEFQEIIRTRIAVEYIADDGAVILAQEPPPGAQGITRREVQQMTAKKSSVAGYTESFLNGIRWVSENDPQNVIFAIDNRVEAATINEIRLQPTLRALGHCIVKENARDVKAGAGKYLLTLQRMLVYFLGSYSSGAFANKMCELACADELEEHRKSGTDGSTVDNLRSRLKSAERPLLVLLSKPKLAGGPIDAEHADGSCHVYEVPCPQCSDRAGKLAGYQQITREALRFDHCRDETGDWDKDRVLAEAHFECIHCKMPRLDQHKRWFNDAKRRRWRRTNFKASPGHISFHISDYYGYLPETAPGRIALKVIKAKGNPVAMQGIRNHHDGLAWELRATKTTAADVLACTAPYKRRTIPRKPFAIILGADVGGTYIKWTVIAFARNGEAWVIDWGMETASPDSIAELLEKKRYHCEETKKPHRIDLAYIDAKYRKEEVHKACIMQGYDPQKKKYTGPHRMWPIAGIPSEIALRSISVTRVQHRPAWFKITVFVDRDAKHELYTERIKGWVNHRAEVAAPRESAGSNPAPDIDPPNAPPLWFPEALRADDDFVKEHCNEHLIQLEANSEGILPDSAREFIWKRKGPNHWGDASKICIVGFRWLTRSDSQPDPKSKPKPDPDRERAILREISGEDQ